MYCSNGNYEAFARPRKPKGVETKTAWFVGSGLASLAGAAFLIRDGEAIGIPGLAFVRKLLMKKLDKTQIGVLLREFGLVTDD